jgi:hypothetical protein
LPAKDITRLFQEADVIEKDYRDGGDRQAY